MHILYYQDGTLVFIGPGQTIAVEKKAKPFPPGAGPFFIPTSSAAALRWANACMSFRFSPMMSPGPCTFRKKSGCWSMDCFAKIRYELEHAIDKHSRTADRFQYRTLSQLLYPVYDRQFITRDTPHRACWRLEPCCTNSSSRQNTRRSALCGLVCRATAFIPNYFGDLVRKETGACPPRSIFSRG